jgi:hypothetical protein
LRGWMKPLNRFEKFENVGMHVRQVRQGGFTVRANNVGSASPSTTDWTRVQRGTVFQTRASYTLGNGQRIVAANSGSLRLAKP